MARIGATPEAIMGIVANGPSGTGGKPSWSGKPISVTRTPGAADGMSNEGGIWTRLRLAM